MLILGYIDYYRIHVTYTFAAYNVSYAVEEIFFFIRSENNNAFKPALDHTNPLIWLSFRAIHNGSQY